MILIYVNGIKTFLSFKLEISFVGLDISKFLSYSSIKQFQYNQETPIKSGSMFKFKTAGWKKWSEFFVSRFKELTMYYNPLLEKINTSHLKIIVSHSNYYILKSGQFSCARIFIFIKGIQDKNSVVYFWLTIFPLLFAPDFQATPTWHLLQKVIKN